MTTCFFIGHRDAPQTLQDKLNAQVKHMIAECGVTDFIVGNYGSFDRMATQAVQFAKAEHPELRAYRLIPYFPDGSAPPIPTLFDGTCYPLGLEKTPKRFCILKANRLLIDESDYLITYVRREGGNAGKFLEYARTRAGNHLITIIEL